MKNTAAFFDIDGTIYRDSLMVEHFKKLIKYEVVDEKAWVDNTRDIFMTWDRRQGNYDDYLFLFLNLCDLYVKSLIGLDKSAIDFATDQVIKLKSERVYTYTRSRIKWHLSQGHKVIFISGSPDFLVKKMAEKYNNNVIFTLGKDGAVAYENGTIEFIPAMKVDAIETTGAGDSYIGAVSHSIIEGKSLIEACKFATKCSAITVCRMGAQPSMPTLEDVE